MKKCLVLAVCFLLSGCAGLFGPKQVATDNRVKTLGVLPVLVDVETIPYSNRDGLVALIEQTSRDVDDWLIEDLRDTGGYFDVRAIDAPADILGRIVDTRVLTEDGVAEHYVYTFNPAGISEVIDAHLVDAVLVVIINGVERVEKRWSTASTRFEYLEAQYRSLLYSAAVVAAPGEVLWTRPIPESDFFLRLDYPDFDEAFWNRTDVVRVKEITLPGLERTLAEIEEGLFVKTTIPKYYKRLIDELVDHLEKGM